MSDQVPALQLTGSSHPELVIGLVGALGVPIERISFLLSSSLTRIGYSSEIIRLSDFLSAYSLSTPDPASESNATKRWDGLMSRGNELRAELGRGDALAMHAVASIAARRLNSDGGTSTLDGQAFVLRQLKNPAEVQLLRQVYGESFHLIGIYTSEDIRHEYLRNVMNLTPEDADRLVRRDAGEEIKYGQQLTSTYHLSDFFLHVDGWRDAELDAAAQQIDKYIDLLFGQQIISPTIDEYGMYLAHAAALRSADLSRQVGAAILTRTGEVLALGANEVPAAGGGQYWGGDKDERDCAKGYDSNEVIKLQSIAEILSHLDDGWDLLTGQQRDERTATVAEQLSNTRVMNLTEFGRAVHAEMEAILSAARVGVPIRGQVLYTTTFPCHNCAKHIVGSGISRVVYVEPYPKSLADRLHGDAIAFSLDSTASDDNRIPFDSFLGVAPRRFAQLFSSQNPDGSRVRWKKKGGSLRTDPVGLRSFSPSTSYVDREAIVASYLDEVMDRLTQLTLEFE